jgi:serine/threonine-protein kinase
MPLAPGTRVGPYEVIGLLGQGGMGEVYRASDTNLKRLVAIKVLPEAVAEDADRLARFQREAEVLASLNHPNIAHIYGFERSFLPDAAGRAPVTALVMELVEGPTLADHVALGPLPLDEALSIARQIAEALEAAHGRGVIHRDLKPANVKVRDDGTAKVLDFGLAKATEPLVRSPDLADTPTATSPVAAAPPWPTMTERGVILGTAPYMSPEQARGKVVDKRTDIWSFGCVLFEMLSGRRPFQGATLPDVLVAVLSKEPDWSLVEGRAPAHIVRLLRHCLEKDSKRRLRDIGDAQLELESAEPQGVTAVVPAGRKVKAWQMVTAAIGIAIASVMAWRWFTSSSSGDVIWRARALVTSSSEEHGSRISPDGRWISFLSSMGGESQLLVQRMDGGEGRRRAPASPRSR